jgi:tetratricopeptide (TPR) repeat protein
MPKTRTAARKDGKATLAWGYVKSFCAGCYYLTTWLFWIIAVAVVATILIQGLSQHATVIAPISVPKVLADGGYTPEVAGRRLRDAMVQYASIASTRMKHPDFALHGDLPDIIVPTVGISLDAVMTTMHTLLRITRSRNITGEFTIKNKLLWLHLRLDGSELYISPEGVDPEKPDDLFTAAIPKILEKVQPYYLAVAQHAKDPEHSLDLVSASIDKLPESDVNVAWLYNLKGNIYREQHADAEAAEAYKKALSLNSSLAVAYLNLGNLLKGQGKRDDAIEHYRTAIKYDSKFALAHYNLGLLYTQTDTLDVAVNEFKRAAEIDPTYAQPHYNLGMIYESQKNHDAAIGEFHKSIALDPNFAQAYNYLGIVLVGRGKSREAIEDFHKAFAADPNNAAAHNNLGDALTDPAQKAAEYREAIRLNPKFGSAYGNLAKVTTDPKEKENAKRQALLYVPTGADVDVDPGAVVTGYGLSLLLGDPVGGN